MDYFIFHWRMERIHVTDYLIGADQKVSDRAVKITFLGEDEAVAIRLGIKFQFGN